MKWQPIETAPYRRVLEVKNDSMDKPVLATRGYVCDGAVHEDQRFFTSVYTYDKHFPFPSGVLVCPTHWRLPPGPPQ